MRAATAAIGRVRSVKPTHAMRGVCISFRAKPSRAATTVTWDEVSGLSARMLPVRQFASFFNSVSSALPAGETLFFHFTGSAILFSSITNTFLQN